MDILLAVQMATKVMHSFTIFILVLVSLFHSKTILIYLMDRRIHELVSFQLDPNAYIKYAMCEMYTVNQELVVC